MSPHGRLPAILVVAVLPFPLLSACGEGADPAWGEITVDTLADGTIHVLNPGTGLWGEEPAWRLVEDVRIGAVEGEGPDVFGQIRGVAVDSRGRVHVLDAQAHELRVFRPDGTHLRTLGGRGEGPGELSQPFGLGIDGSDRVWVADWNNRYTVWDSSGALAGTRARPFVVFPFMTTFGFDGDRLIESSTLGTGDEESRPALIRLSLEDEVADTFPVPRFEPEVYALMEGGLMRMAATVPFSPGQSRALGQGDHYWMGTGDRYRLHRVRLQGDTVRIVEREYERVPVTRAERDSALGTPFLRRMREEGGEVDPARIPDHKPAFRSLQVEDRGYLWVVLPNPAGEEGTRLDVFDPEGRYLGQLRSDRTMRLYPPPVVRGEVLWAHLTDELDVSYVAGFRIAGRD